MATLVLKLLHVRMVVPDKEERIRFIPRRKTRHSMAASLHPHPSTKEMEAK